MKVPSLKGKEKKVPQAAEDNTSIHSVAIADTSPTSMTSDSKELYARLEAALRQQVEVTLLVELNCYGRFVS